MLENTFRKLDLFPSSGEGRETSTPLGRLERTNCNHWIEAVFSKGPNRVSPFLHVKTGTDRVSETLCFLEFRIPDVGQSPETQ
jgi:hypothetical protein